MLKELGRKPIEIREKLVREIKRGIIDLEEDFGEYMDAGYKLITIGTGYYSREHESKVYLKAMDGLVDFYVQDIENSEFNKVDIEKFDMEGLIKCYDAIKRARACWKDNIERIVNEAEESLS